MTITLSHCDKFHTRTYFTSKFIPSRSISHQDLFYCYTSVSSIFIFIHTNVYTPVVKIYSVLSTYKSVPPTRDILNCISLIPPIGILSLPVVNSRHFFCKSDGKFNSTSQKFLKKCWRNSICNVIRINKMKVQSW